MTQPMIQIDWLDGKITRVPEYDVGNAFGENIQPELDIRLEDLSDGIWIYLRHNEPNRPKQGVHEKQDPKGLSCTVYADAFYQIATKEDIEKIAVLSYEGVPRLINDNGELINLSKFNALRNLYLGDDSSSIALQAASLFKILQERSGGTEDEIAKQLGLSPAFLQHARSLALQQDTAQGEQPTEDADIEADEPADQQPDDEAILAASLIAASLAGGSTEDEPDTDEDSYF